MQWLQRKYQVASTGCAAAHPSNCAFTNSPALYRSESTGKSLREPSNPASSFARFQPTALSELLTALYIRPDSSSCACMSARNLASSIKVVLAKPTARRDMPCCSCSLSRALSSGTRVAATVGGGVLLCVRRQTTARTARTA